jgi:hypothetical protein
MKRLLFLIMLVAVTQFALAQQTINATQRYEPVDEPFRVHGRLSVYCGNPSCRIWIVGTNRILGIREIEEKPLIPPGLHRILKEDINDRLIYADFVVSPLTRYKEGVMQMVKVESAENVVVTTHDMRFLKRLTGIIK